MSKRREAMSKWCLLVLVVCLIFVGCDRDRKSDDPTPNTPTVSGTVAAGAPLANAQITFKDKAGKTLTATTNANGKYSADVSGFTAPIWIRVGSSSPYLYTMCFEVATGTTNLHPYTDLVVRKYYEALGISDMDDFFANLSTSSLTPTKAELSAVTSKVLNALAAFLQQNGIDYQTFDLFSTPFNADGTGFDKILDSSDFTVVNQVTMTDGNLSQVVTFTAKRRAIPTVSLSGTITNNALRTADGRAVESGYEDETTVTVGSAEAAQEAEAFLNDFLTYGNQQAENISASDDTWRDMFDDDYLFHGKNKDLERRKIAQEVRYGTPRPNPPAVVTKTYYYNPNDNGFPMIDVAVTAGGVDNGSRVTLKKGVGDKWRWWCMGPYAYHKQFEARITNSIQRKIDAAGVNTDTRNFKIEANDQAQNGLSSQVNVTSPLILALTLQPRNEDVQDEPEPATPFDHVFQSYWYGSTTDDYPAGTLFHVVIKYKPLDASPDYEEDVVLGATCSETMAGLVCRVGSTNIGHDLVQALGQTVVLSFDSPTTYALAPDQLESIEGDVICWYNLSDPPQPNDWMSTRIETRVYTNNSMTYQVPTTVTVNKATYPVLAAQLRVRVPGVHGERMETYWDLGTPPWLPLPTRK